MLHPAHSAPVQEGVSLHVPDSAAENCTGSVSLPLVEAESGGAGLACATKNDESDDLTRYQSVPRLPPDDHHMTHKGGSGSCPAGNCPSCEAAKMTQEPVPSKSGYDRGQDLRVHLDSVGPSRAGATADGQTATHFTLAVHPKTKKLWSKLFKKVSPDTTEALVRRIERELKKDGH